VYAGPGSSDSNAAAAMRLRLSVEFNEEIVSSRTGRTDALQQDRD